MDNRPFLSVVLPIYNVEAYLRDALQSLLGQSFSDYEIILVDDCSPDQSAEICREYCEKYPFIRYVRHEQNRGLSAARNSGIEAARGRYIWFMDPDDVIEGDDLFALAAEKAAERAYDVLIFGFRECYYDDGGRVVKTVPFCPQALETDDRETLGKLILQLEKMTAFGYAWNKFYSLDLIREHGLSYENIPLTEDVKFNILYFDRVNAAAVLAITPYCYAKRPGGSLTARFVPRYFEVHRERVDMMYDLCERFGACDDEAKNSLANIFVRYVFSALSRNCDARAAMSHAARKAWLKDLFADPLFLKLIPYAGASSTVLKMMIALLKGRHTAGCLATGRVIFFAQTRLRPLFIRLKQNRT